MTRKNRWSIILIGLGIALAPIHNRTLIDWATLSNGETVFFLPSFAFIFIILGSGLFLRDNWDQVRRVGWGDRRVVIPLFIIAAAIALSGVFTAEGLEAKVAPLGMGIALIALYLSSRLLGKVLFVPLGIGAVITAIGVILYSLLHPGVYNGGYVFESNINACVGYMTLGSILWQHRHQWIVIGLCLIALIMCGAPESAIPVGVIGLAILIRRDWSIKLAGFAVAAAIVLGVLFASGEAQSLYNYLIQSVTGVHTVDFIQDGVRISQSPLGFRIYTIQKALSDLQPFGIGYSMTKFDVNTVHNVPLILVQQLGYPGILAALAWLWVTFWCLFKTTWKYAFIAIIALSLFDNYIWGQLGLIWWIAIGASTVSLESDLIFKKQNNQKTVPALIQEINSGSTRAEPS